MSRRQAAEVDLTRHQVRSRIRAGVLDEPLRGVLRVVGSRPTWHQRAMTCVLAFEAKVSHRSAGWMQGLDGFAVRGVPDLIELSIVRSRRGVDAPPNVVVHTVRELDDEDVVVIDGLPVTSVARTLCDLGAVVPDDVVEQALDSALRQGAPLPWIEQTLRRLDRPGPSGTHSLVRVLARPDRAGVVPESWRERVTERLLHHPELSPLARQYEIRDQRGEVVARVDLAVPSVRLGIEFHSDQWHYGPRRGRKDRRRDLALSRLGWEIVYLDIADHDSPQAALEAVLDVARVRRRQFRAS